MERSGIRWQAGYIPTGLFILLATIAIILHFNGLYGQDGYEYLRYEKALVQYYNTGIRPVDTFFPIFYPLVGSVLECFFLHDILCMQLVSILSFCIAFVYMDKLISLIYNSAPQASKTIYLLFFFCLSPYVFRFSLLAMSDMLAMCLCIAVCYYSLRYINRRIGWDFVLFAGFFTSAVLTRTACAALLFVPFVVSVYFAVRAFRVSYIILSILLAGILTIPDYMLRHRLFIFNLDYKMLSYMQCQPEWSVSNWFRWQFHGINGNQSYMQPNLVYVCFNFFHPAWIFAGIVLIPFIRKQDFRGKYIWICLASIILYALFIAGFDTQNMRFLLLSFPMVIAFMYPAFMRVWLFITRKKMKIISICIFLVIQISCVSYSFNKVCQMNLADRKLVAIMRAYPGKTIYTFGIDEALNAYSLPDKTINIWYHQLEKIEPNSLVLLQADAVEKQFKDRNPGINWRILQKYGHLTLINNLDDGWKLYQVNL